MMRACIRVMNPILVEGAAKKQSEHDVWPVAKESHANVFAAMRSLREVIEETDHQYGRGTGVCSKDGSRRHEVEWVVSADLKALWIAAGMTTGVSSPCRCPYCMLKSGFLRARSDGSLTGGIDCGKAPGAACDGRDEERAMDVATNVFGVCRPAASSSARCTRRCAWWRRW